MQAQFEKVAMELTQRWLGYTRNRAYQEQTFVSAAVIVVFFLGLSFLRRALFLRAARQSTS
jgi:hypothetical protein